MNLYLISQNVNNNYDTYNSAVVAAESVDAARLIHPSGIDGDTEIHDWCCEEDIMVKLIGIAEEGVSGVVCASFNSGDSY